MRIPTRRGELRVYDNGSASDAPPTTREEHLMLLAMELRVLAEDFVRAHAARVEAEAKDREP